MDRWKAEMWRVREKRRVEERRSKKRKSQKKEDAGARKGRKVAKHCVILMICGSGGSKNRLAKAGAEPSGQMRDEKLHTVVARSIFPSQKVQNTTCSDRFWKLRCWESARLCGAKHISKSKCTKHFSFGAILRVAMWKKCTPLWREARFEVNMLKAPGFRTTFGRWDVVWRGSPKGLDTLSKVSKMWGFCSMSKTMAGVGHLKRICQDAFRVAGAVQETCSLELLGGPGADFPERGCILEHQIFRFAEVILRDRCSTSYDLASLFCGRRSKMDWKIRKTHWYEAVSSALNFSFLKDVSQNCFVFDVVNLEKIGCLAEFIRFWCCQV